MDQVSESVSKMACKNCGKIIVKNSYIGILWEHEYTTFALCYAGDPNSTAVAEPEQAMSS